MSRKLPDDGQRIAADDAEERVELPNWMFDIDDEDETISSSKSLFQELEIDPNHIYR